MWNKLLSVVQGRPKYTDTIFMSTIEKITTENSAKKVIAAMGTLVEILIWGEQHDRDFFGMFYGENVMTRLANLLMHPSNSVVTALLKSLAMLIHNIREDRNFQVTIARQALHSILNYRPHYSDEESIQHLVVLTKAIALRTDNLSLHYLSSNENVLLHWVCARY